MTLDEVLDRLIPDDGFAGAKALGIGGAVAALVPELDTLLARIESDDDLEALDASADPAFAALVAAAHAVFYADPGSWPAIGYTTNVPGRP